MDTLKNRLTNLTINSSLFAHFVSLLQALDDQPSDILRVLTYHRVDVPENRPYLYPGLSVPPTAFTAQMEFLASSYKPISIQDILKRLSEHDPKPLPPRAVLVTFDDAYQDFQEFAWPVLKRLYIPAVLFVPTAFPDCPERSFWWDTLHHILSTTKKPILFTPLGEFPLTTRHQRIVAYKRIRSFLTLLPHEETLQMVDNLVNALEVSPAKNNILSWADLRKLSAEGVSMGAHTKTHPRLDRITPQESEREIIASLDDLAEGLGSFTDSLPIFAYPGGGVNDQVVQILDRLRIKVAFSTERGINKFNKANALRLKRINIGQRTNIAVLQAQLLHRPSRLLSKFI